LQPQVFSTSSLTYNPVRRRNAMSTVVASSISQTDTAALSLGPSLPMAVYTAMEPWHAERIHALALYCSDGRWGDAFDEFCHRHLQIPRYDRWAVPGGPAWLASPASDPAFLETARGQLDFLVRLHELKRIVLITHYGCAHYGERLQKSPDDCLAAQVKDVAAAAKALAHGIPASK
jgi:hypothetical protein